MNTIILLIAAFISCLQSQEQEEYDAVCISQMSQDIISQIRTDIDDIFNDCYFENEFNQLMTSTPAPTIARLNINEVDNNSDKPTVAPIAEENEFEQLTPTISISEGKNNNFNAPTLAPIPEDIINAVIETINERGIALNETNEIDDNITNISVVLGSNEEDIAVCLSHMSQDILSLVRTDLNEILADCYEENGFDIDQLTPTPTISRLNISESDDNFNAPTLAPIPEDIISAITEIINERGIDTNETSDGDIGDSPTNAPNHENNQRCSKTDESCQDDNDCCGSLECNDGFFCVINRL